MKVSVQRGSTVFILGYIEPDTPCNYYILSIYSVAYQSIIVSRPNQPPPFEDLGIRFIRGRIKLARVDGWSISGTGL